MTEPTPPDSKQLTTIYKKNGQFDSQRKQLLENFKQSETYANLLLKLKILVENKVKQDPTILTKNKGKMAALIQGEIINDSSGAAGLLSIVDRDIQDKIIDSPEFHNVIREQLMDIRRILMGISDEEYAKQREQEKLRLERLKLEAKFANNTDYKNNFRVKSLSSTTHRVTKPPRFNIHSNSKHKFTI
ncbi:uncharacterized protein SPAPADRAFT_53584 [Spathaspora passalidarum NRRL Y-27907]|uniref:BOD1/SHG1 domain-containing protein n=1 Tax=Spathaspora passalidarum (strain NRRL Y-27907 / 11-Y1) TaxID=619300 RepID=G3AGE8_SPAPN|nr:uncharacterized protein SPAPADRAFT_53584 [Spathaspora passalidarum NRRL Y-27907]EGW35287.1 hypothetical protein SPAPADRAFT_53584 [Spathaspora passalidarum NRRL Y-27907]